MTKRIFALIFAILMIATVLAACSDDKDNNSTTATPTTTATPSTSAISNIVTPITIPDNTIISTTATPTTTATPSTSTTSNIVTPTTTPANTIINTTDPLTGSWYTSTDGIEATYTFNGDGTGSIDMMGIVLDMTYTTSGNTVTYTMSYDGSDLETQTLEYSISGNELTPTDGEYPVVFTKQ